MAHSGINNADAPALDQPCPALREPLVTTTSEHPATLSFVLVRYKFVANLLAGRHDVCELGRSNPFGIRLVSPQVKKIAVYDSNRTFVAKFRSRNQDVRMLQVDLHDIVLEHLPKTYDSIYSFDVLERTAPEYEEDCIRHIRDSLSDDCGIAVIGCSAAQPDARFSDNTTEPIYVRSGAALKELLHRHFNTVLLFSMHHDEIIQPGISSNTPYFLALCCGKKT